MKASDSKSSKNLWKSLISDDTSILLIISCKKLKYKAFDSKKTLLMFTL